MSDEPPRISWMVRTVEVPSPRLRCSLSPISRHDFSPSPCPSSTASMHGSTKQRTGHSAPVHPHACFPKTTPPLPSYRWEDVLRKERGKKYQQSNQGMLDKKGKQPEPRHSSWRAKASVAQASPQDPYDCTAAMVNDHPLRWGQLCPRAK